MFWGVFAIMNKIKILRSDPRTERLGLTFEPRTIRPPQFPLRTSYVAPDLQEDIKEFLKVVISTPIHRMGSLATQIPEEYFKGEAEFGAAKRISAWEITH